jgi:hypothetical protein
MEVCDHPYVLFMTGMLLYSSYINSACCLQIAIIGQCVLCSGALPGLGLSALLVRLGLGLRGQPPVYEQRMWPPI